MHIARAPRTVGGPPGAKAAMAERGRTLSSAATVSRCAAGSSPCDVPRKGTAAVGGSEFAICG